MTTAALKRLRDAEVGDLLTAEFAALVTLPLLIALFVWRSL